MSRIQGDCKEYGLRHRALDGILYGDLRQERPGTTVKQADRHLLEEYRRGKA